jgi:single-strand DNA-binding protein
MIMNHVTLIGRLGKDVEFKNTTSGTAVANFPLAVSRRFKKDNQPAADFLPIIVWGKSAEFAQKYFAKGQQVYVVGRIEVRSWDDKEGKKHYATEIIAEELGFADTKKADKNDNLDVAPSGDSEDELPF